MGRRIAAAILALIAVVTTAGIAGARPAGTPSHAGVWSPVLTEGITGPAFTGVSCPTATSCFALGTGQSWLFERYDGRRLSRLPVPLFDNSGAGAALACPSTRSCAAVGTHHHRPVAARWNGRTWTLTPLPLPVASRSERRYSELTSVSCPTSTICVAVGRASGGGLGSPLIERWNGSRWRVVPTGLRGGELDSVSCASATSCMAVGSMYQRASFVGRGLALRLGVARQTPTRVTLPNVPGAAGIVPQTVSCSVTSRCIMAGLVVRTVIVHRHPYTVPARVALLVPRGDGWQPRVARIGAGKALNMDAIACAPGAALQCTAVGDLNDNSEGFSLTLTATGTLQAQKVPTDAGPSAIACPSLRFCLAGGLGIERYEFPRTRVTQG
jgi:hypothetical protein